MKFGTLNLRLFVFSIACLTVGLAQADELKQTLKDLDVGERWAYNDWESAKSAAAKSKKPILALFR